MAITAQDVMKLRKMTSAGMMDCKNALNEANGNFEEAVKIKAEHVRLSNDLVDAKIAAAEELRRVKDAAREEVEALKVAVEAAKKEAEDAKRALKTKSEGNVLPTT